MDLKNFLYANKRILAAILVAVLAALLIALTLFVYGSRPAGGSSGNESPSSELPESVPGDESGLRSEAGLSSGGFASSRKGASSAASSSKQTEMEYKDTANNIIVDFSTKDFSETPYLKKFDMFSCTWSWLNPAKANTVLDKNSIETIPSIAKLRPENIRTDLFMGYGGIGGKIGSSTTLKGTTAAEYALVEQLTALWRENGIRGNFCYFANPVYSGGGVARWKTAPDPAKWRTLCYNIAKYFKDNRLGVMTHEIWNEPEYFEKSPQEDGFFFSGSWQEYIDTYIAGAMGIREADRDAIIGGVSAAWIHKLQQDGRYSQFLKQVKDAGAPLDYVSWHYYGYYGNYSSLESYIDAARKGLEADPAYSTVQQHLNEFNVTCQGQTYKTYGMTELVFNVFRRLLSATDITRVSWAAPLEYDTIKPALCLIDPYTFERYPAYRAMWMYARLPVERVKVSGVPDGVEVLAACSEGRAALIAYDTADKKQEVTFSFKGLNMDRCDASVYVIDKENPVSDPKSDEPLLIKQYKNVKTANARYTVTVPKEGVVYIEFNDASKPFSLDVKSGYSSYVARKDYWYPQRGDNYAFADVHLSSMSAYVGAGTAKEGLGAACSVTLDGMKGKKLSVAYETVGSPKKRSSDSMLGIQVAYEVDGAYKKSVYFYLNDINGWAQVPLGTGRKPEKSVFMGGKSGLHTVSLANYAPSGWSGRIQLCYVVNNVGKGSGAVFRLK